MADSKQPDLSRGDAPLQGAIDQAPKGGHYIVNGVHVDANGQEVNDDGSAKGKDA